MCKCTGLSGLIVLAAAVTVRPAGPEPAPPRDYLVDLALVIGCSPGSDTEGVVALCVRNDAEAVAGLLKKRGHTKVTALIGPEATARAILDTARALGDTKSKSGRVLLCVSGAFETRGGRLFLLPYDAGPGRPEAAIGVDAVLAQLQRGGLTDFMVILDASAMPWRPAGAESIRLDLPAEGNTVVVLAWPAKRRRETKEAVLHSPFTRAMLDTWTDPAKAGRTAWTWLPATLAEVQGADDPHASPPRVQVYSHMTNAMEAMWLNVPLVKAVPKDQAPPATTRAAARKAPAATQGAATGSKAATPRKGRKGAKP